MAGAAVVSGQGPYGPLLAADANGIQLPAGFTSRLIGTSGNPVGTTGYEWHAAPDGGACFAVPGGGWIYASNSEVGSAAGGVSAIRFAADGAVDAAYRILAGTSRNCSGGPTPWGTWLSCEENGAAGKVYECDPQQPGQGVQRPLLGSFAHEAAAVDPLTGIVYLTEDDALGRLYRFVPATPGTLTNGVLQAASLSGTAVTWAPVSTTTPDRSAGTTAFNGGEGAWISAGTLWFTTKNDRRIWELDLATQQLTVLFSFATTAGSSLNAVDNVTVHEPSGDLFIAEDGGNMELCILGAVAGQDTVAPFLRFMGHEASEVAGPAFSPDGNRLYVSSQRGTDGVTGVTYEITGPFRSAGPPPPPPSTTVVPVTVDSYVRDGTYASTNYGTVPTLQVCRSASTGSNRVAYYQVDTAGVAGAVTSAKLRLWCRGTSATANVLQVRAVASAWSEAAITWANRPALGAVVGSFTLASTTYAWQEVDVTAFVQAQREAGQPAVSFAVEPSVANHNLVYVASGESPSNQPQLVITQDGAPPPPPPPPPSTTVVPVTVDSYVRDGTHASTNYGTVPTLQVCRSASTGSNRVAYYQVDTAGVAGAVTSAKLRLWCRGTSATANVLQVRAVASAWSEAAITWANRPALGAVVGSFTLASTTYAWQEVDVTAFVQAQREAGQPAVSFAVEPSVANHNLVYVASGESPSNQPQLVINA